MTTNRTTVRRSLACAAAVLSLLAAAGCSSDASDGSPATTTTSDGGASPTSAAPTSSSSTDAPEGYCDASLAIEQDPGPDIDFSSATEEEMAAAAKAYASGTLRDLFDGVAAVAPAELDDAVQTYDEAITQLAASGDFSAFETPELAEAEATAHAYDLDHCGWAPVDVVTTDYAFSGIADTADAGTVSFELSNEGDELHELVLLRVDDDVDLSAEELLALPQEEAEGMVQQVGGTDPIEPGSTGYVVADLQPGRYLVSCFLPVGATSYEAMESLGPDAMPHAAHGMVHEITVS